MVNAAGHGAQQLAHATEGYPQGRVPRHVMAKGNYFKFSGKTPFSRLIYPAPVPGGLGVHITLDLGGGMKFGPDVEWIDTESYKVDPARAPSFYGYIRKYWPDLPDGSLIPDYAGILRRLRARVSRPQTFASTAHKTTGCPASCRCSDRIAGPDEFIVTRRVRDRQSGRLMQKRCRPRLKEGAWQSVGRRGIPNPCGANWDRCYSCA